MLLTVKQRQIYLKELGYYLGEIDDKVGSKMKKAYKDLQNDYFTRSKDKDGYYGPNTDILLRSAYNCKESKYFKLQEFKCKCDNYCTGYPVELNKDLIVNLNALREHFGKPCTIVSGLRCSKHNSTVGGASGSRHKSGKAADIYITNISTTKDGKQEIVNHWIETYSTARYAYCNGYARSESKTTYPIVKTMGTSTHVDVK